MRGDKTTGTSPIAPPALSRDQDMKAKNRRTAKATDPPPLPLPPATAAAAPSHIVHRRSVGRFSVAASVYDVPNIAVHSFGAQATQGGQARVRVALEPFSYRLAVAGSFLGENL